MQIFDSRKLFKSKWACYDSLDMQNKAQDKILSNSLSNKNLDITLRTNRLRWFGHVYPCGGRIKKCTKDEVAGKRERGRPRKTWQQCVNYDLKSLKRGTKNGEKPNPQDMWNMGSIRTINQYQTKIILSEAVARRSSWIFFKINRETHAPKYLL